MIQVDYFYTLKITEFGSWAILLLIAYCPINGESSHSLHIDDVTAIDCDAAIYYWTRYVISAWFLRNMNNFLTRASLIFIIQ